MPETKVIADLGISLTDSQKISLNIITINTAINDLQTDMRELNRVVILGNGDLPLREQVRNNTSFIVTTKYWTRFVFGALILQTITFGVGIVVAIIRFLPVLEKIATP